MYSIGEWMVSQLSCIIEAMLEINHLLWLHLSFSFYFGLRDVVYSIH